MSDTVRMQAFVEADLDDVEECIAKDYRHYVKLKSRDEPYEVDEDTYEKVLAWIAEMNAKRKEPKRCPFCGSKPYIIEGTWGKWGLTTYAYSCSNCTCVSYHQKGDHSIHNISRCDEQSAANAWNRRAE